MSNDLTKSYYKIGEVSEILGIPEPTLRYWEKQFSILKPRRSEKGDRRYTPADIEKIRLVRYYVKERGLKIEAAEAAIKANPDRAERRFKALERLKGVKSELEGLLKALGSLRD